ncbi:MAG: DNA methyltransferase, partial [Roseibium sp.]
MTTKARARANHIEQTEDAGSDSEIVRSSYHSSAKNVAGILKGDSAQALSTLPDESFNVAITSPPYFWVRDYGYEGQLGHEATVDAYIEGLMKVFDEVKRTLHPEGVFFLNIGDTFYSGNG